MSDLTKGDTIRCLINPWAEFGVNVPPGTLGTVQKGGEFFASVRWKTGVSSKSWKLHVDSGSGQVPTVELVSKGAPPKTKRFKKASIRTTKGGGIEVELFPGTVWKY